jgi:hypothetical protein
MIERCGEKVDLTEKKTGNGGRPTLPDLAEKQNSFVQKSGLAKLIRRRANFLLKKV